MVRSLKQLGVRNKYFKVKSFVGWRLYYMRALKDFDNLHEGQSCFIIGNGPSLNKMNLALLKDCTCFGLNKIHMHPDVTKIGINYHVAVNPLVIEQSFSDFRSLNCPSFLSYNASAGQRVKNSLYKFILTGTNPAFSPNPYSKMDEGSTVTYVALQLAYFMGFSKVFLIGVDHNFAAPGKPHEKQLLEGADTNHFHPDYFAGQEWHLPDLEGSEMAYCLARDYYAQNERHIFDATVGGNLNVFPKIEYHEAIALCNSH